MALVVPSAPHSPHLDTLLASVKSDWQHAVFVVSESASGPGRRVLAEPGDGFAQRANKGLRAARDAGFHHAALLNDDLELLPGCLEALHRRITEEGVGIVGAEILHWDGDGIQQAGIGVSLRTGRIRELTRTPASVQAVSGAAMAIDLGCWQELGGFDERYTFYFEDIDFCLRARRAGWSIALCSDARAKHRGGGTRSRKSPAAAWHLGHSQAVFSRGLPGGRVDTVRRLLCSGAWGLGWSARASGLSGMGSFARGWTAGLRG